MFTADNHQESTDNEENFHSRQYRNKQRCSLCNEPILFSSESSQSTSQATTNFKCEECLNIMRSIPSGLPFKLVNEVKEYECPICLSLIKDATELSCTHLMCKACLVYYEDGEIRKHKE